MKIKIQEFLDACLLRLISDCWKKKIKNQRNILMNNGKDLRSSKNSLHNVLIESQSLVSKKVKQNTSCILSEFSFRFLFTTINLKKRISVRVGGCCISGSFVVCFLLLQLCCICFSAYLIFKQVCHILKKTSKQKASSSRG